MEKRPRPGRIRAFGPGRAGKGTAAPRPVEDHHALDIPVPASTIARRLARLARLAVHPAAARIAGRFPHGVRQVAAAMSARLPHRRPLLVLVAIAMAGLSLLVVSALQDTVTYYRTPSEVAAHPALIGQHVRLGGRVVAGSIRHTGVQINFAMTDGLREVAVVHQGDPPGTFREDQDAVVEGVPESDGVFHADRVIVKHSNEYRPANGQPDQQDTR